MKKRTFWIIESIMIVMTLSGFIAYGVLRGLGYTDSSWPSITLGIGIIGLVIFLFFLVMRIFNSASLPETRQGMICPRCHFLNEENSKVCKQCGHPLEDENHEDEKLAETEVSKKDEDESEN